MSIFSASQTNANVFSSHHLAEYCLIYFESAAYKYFFKLILFRMIGRKWIFHQNLIFWFDTIIKSNLIIVFELECFCMIAWHYAWNNWLISHPIERIEINLHEFFFYFIVVTFYEAVTFIVISPWCILSYHGVEISINKFHVIDQKKSKFKISIVFHMYVMKNGHIMMKLCVTLFFIGLMIVASSDSRSNEATMLSRESSRKDAENSNNFFF